LCRRKLPPALLLPLLTIGVSAEKTVPADEAAIAGAKIIDGWYAALLMNANGTFRA
jgi:hypothetical protein